MSSTTFMMPSSLTCNVRQMDDHLEWRFLSIVCSTNLFLGQFDELHHRVYRSLDYVPVTLVRSLAVVVPQPLVKIFL